MSILQSRMITNPAFDGQATFAGRRHRGRDRTIADLSRERVIVLYRGAVDPKSLPTKERRRDRPQSTPSAKSKSAITCQPLLVCTLATPQAPAALPHRSAERSPVH